MKVLVATEKPFAKIAVDGIKKEIEGAGFELALLEKYTDKAQLLDAVKDANAIIIRSDIIDAEVLEAAKELKIVVRAGAGYDNVDLNAATAHGVCVMNTPGQNSNAVTERCQDNDRYLFVLLLDMASDIKTIVVSRTRHANHQIKRYTPKLSQRLFLGRNLRKTRGITERKRGVFIENLFIDTSVILQHKSIVRIGYQ